MRLDKLILENFLTYEFLEYEFERRPLQIQGLNLTDEDQKSNGSGKSGIQSGIEFCIAASNSRDVRDSELITYGFKESRVQLFASCDVRKEKLHIDWTIRLKGSNRLTLWTRSYDGKWKEVSFSNVNDGKKYILAWFAISKEDLFNYYIINKTRFKSFFKSSNKEKVDLINRFSDASIIQGLEDIDVEDLLDEHDSLEHNISRILGKLELIGSSIIREKQRDFKAEMKDDVEDLEEEIEDLNEKIEVEGDSILLYTEKIAVSRDYINDAKLDIISVLEERVGIREKIEVINANISEVNKEVGQQHKILDKFKSTDWDSKRFKHEEVLDNDNMLVDEIEIDVQNIELKEDKLLMFLRGIEVKLGGTIECPSCQFEWIRDDNLDKVHQDKQQGEGLLKVVLRKLKNETNSLKALKEGIGKLEKTVSAINKLEKEENDGRQKLVEALNLVNEKVSTVEGRLRLLNRELEASQDAEKDFKAAISRKKEMIENHNGKIDLIEAGILLIEKEQDGYKTDIKKLKVGNSKAAIKELKDQKHTMEVNLREANIKVSKVGDKIYEKNQWINNFKQFRMYLANQSLEVIEYHSNRYLKEMGSDMTVKMEGFKVLANGTYKEEITAKVIRGIERTFSSFSGGEQGRLLFASILANRHMINQTHPYGGLDFLSIDEVFEGVDSLGLKYLIESAKTLGIAVMIITHITDEDVSSDVLMVVKENGVSTIKK